MASRAAKYISLSKLWSISLGHQCGSLSLDHVCHRPTPPPCAIGGHHRTMHPICFSTADLPNATKRSSPLFLQAGLSFELWPVPTAPFPLVCATRIGHQDQSSPQCKHLPAPPAPGVNPPCQLSEGEGGLPPGLAPPTKLARALSQRLTTLAPHLPTFFHHFAHCAASQTCEFWV